MAIVMLAVGKGEVAAATNGQGPTMVAWLAGQMEDVPHRFGGDNPQTGLDNSGLVYYVYRQIGVNMPRSLAQQAQFGNAVAKNSLQAGDLVFFKGPSTSALIHVGIYLGDGQFIASASQTGGVKKRDINSAYYREHYLGARRVPPSSFMSVVDLVKQKADASIGMPYRSGQATAVGVDNTGLMKYIYGQVFLEVPTSLNELAKVGVAIPRSSLRVGDMIFFGSSKAATQAYRVGMYVGQGDFVVIDADLGRVVKRSLSLAFYNDRYLFARRPYANYMAPAGSGVVGDDPQPPVTAPTPAVADKIIADALAQLGKRYALGASGPAAFDCSGLTLAVFARQGYKLPRASYNQAKVGQAVRLQDLKKGDLVFFRNTWRNNGSIDHVAIYIGGGKIVHAIRAGVSTSNLTGYWLEHFAGARRII